MKELTYKDWLKNPIPRMMWVWDFNKEAKEQRKVIYINEDATYPVITVDGNYVILYMHCAEIEPTKSRRFTYRELSIWLQEKPTREYKYLNSAYICHSYDYLERNQDIEVHEDIRIREDNGEWHIPIKENE